MRVLKTHDPHQHQQFRGRVSRKKPVPEVAASDHQMAREFRAAAEYSPEAYEKLKRAANEKRQRKWFKPSSKIHQWYVKQNWKELKQDFTLKLKPDGTFFYPSALAFVKVKWTVVQERQYAYWVIGPRPTKYVPWLGNWALERFGEHWRTDARVRALAEQVRKELDATKIAMAAGDVLTDYIGRFITVQAQVDELYGGRIVLEGLPHKRNRTRVNEYLNLTQRTMGLIKEAVEGILDASGGRKLLMLKALTRTVEERTQPGESPESGTKRVVGQLVELALEKSRIFGMPMPELKEVEEEKTVKGVRIA